MALSQSNLKPGDLIEIFRNGYEHWALYVGNGYVVHLTALGDNSEVPSANLKASGTGRALVKKELLSEVAGTDEYRVNNKHDGKYAPLPPSEIVRRAEALVGREMLYKLTSANCEHFVNELRYGVPRSDQVAKGYKASFIWILGGICSIAVAPALEASMLGAAAAYGISTFVTDTAWQLWKKR